MSAVRPLVLITRPEADARLLARDLEARGFETLVAPLMTIHPLSSGAKGLDLSGVQALAFTSANGVRAFVAALGGRPWPELPVFAVGETTASAAREAGAVRIISAGGDVVSLAARIAALCRPGDGAILHVAGSVRAGDLAGDLEGKGFATRRAVLYEARLCRRLPEAAAEALRRGDGFVLIFSPRTARHFAKLVEEAGLADALSCARLVALSPAVAAAAPSGWQAVEVAAQPTRPAMIEALIRMHGESARRQSTRRKSATGDQGGRKARPTMSDHD